MKENLVYCACPKCKRFRKKEGKYWNIVKRGYERNGIARFFCKNCKNWFNEKTGDTRGWYER